MPTVDCTKAPIPPLLSSPLFPLSADRPRSPFACGMLIVEYPLLSLSTNFTLNLDTRARRGLRGGEGGVSGGGTAWVPLEYGCRVGGGGVVWRLLHRHGHGHVMVGKVERLANLKSQISAKVGEIRRNLAKSGERGQKRGASQDAPFRRNIPTESFSVQNRFSPLFPRKHVKTGFFLVN